MAAKAKMFLLFSHYERDDNTYFGYHKPATKLDRFEELTWQLAQQGRALSGPAYLGALSALQSNARQVARFFANYDVWLTPTLAEPPLPWAASTHNRGIRCTACSGQPRLFPSRRFAK